MFVDNFMEMLPATSPRMVHLLSSILPISYQQFGGYLTNKLKTASLYNMISNIAPHKTGLKAHYLGGQLTGHGYEIKYSPNSPFLCVLCCMSCWNLMSCKSSSCIWSKTKVGYHFKLAPTIHSYVTMHW